MQANARAADATLAVLKSHLESIENTVVSLDIGPLAADVAAAKGLVDQVAESLQGVDREGTAAARSVQKIGGAETAASLAAAKAEVSSLGDTLTQTTFKAVALDTALAGTGPAAAGAVSAGTGGTAAADLGLLAAAGVGGGRGLWLPPPFGFGFRGLRVGGGMAAFGSLLGLAGFGVERAVTSSLGILGSIGGGLAGGALLGAGALGTTAVGFGTDLAGIGQAAGDIKTVSQALTQLQTAVATYGKNSQEAAVAQAQLNQALAGFSPVARGAVLSAARTGQAFRDMFDQATGQAEKTGAQIIQQAMLTGEKFLPTIGAFAAENMHIIQAQLQPLFAWLGNASFTRPGFGGGLGIFTNLEQIFQRNLPTAVQAGSQAFEFLIRTVDVAAQQTGHFMATLDRFFTHMNQPGPFSRWAAEVNNLIGLFRTWMGLLGAVVGAIADVFKPAVGFGRAFAAEMTVLINQFRQWLNLASTQSTLRDLFSVHLVQTIQGIGGAIAALLPVIENAASAFMHMEIIVAGALTTALRALDAVLGAITRHPLVATLLGWGAAFAIVAKVNVALAGTFGRMLGLLPAQTSETMQLTEAINAQTAATERLVAANGALAGSTGAVAGATGAETGLFMSNLTVDDLMGVGALRAAVAGVGSSLMRALPLAIGGLIAGQISQQAGGPTALTRALQFGGIGAGIGSIVPGVGTLLGAGVGAGVGALVGVLSTLGNTTPLVTQKTLALSASFTLLAAHARASGAALLQYQQQAGGTISSVSRQLAANLAQVATQLQKAWVGPTASQIENGQRAYHQVTLSATQSTTAFIQKLEQMGASMAQSKPKIAAVYLEVARLMRELNQLPTKKNILIDLHMIVTGDLPARNMFGGSLFAPHFFFRSGDNVAQIQTAVPKALQEALARAEAGQGGNVKQINAQIYAFYAKQLKEAGLTAAQRTKLYQAMIPFAPAPGTVASANLGRSGTGLLSPALQRQLLLAQQAQAAARPAAGVTGAGTTAADLQHWINANQKVMQSAQQSLAYLRAQHYTQQQQVRALQQEKQLLDEIAAAHRNILAAQRAEHQLEVQQRINRILGIGGGASGSSISIESQLQQMLLRGLEHITTAGMTRHRGQTALSMTAQALGITPAQLARESPAKLMRQLQEEGFTFSRQQIMELKKIQEILTITHREGVKLNSAQRAKIEEWLHQINTTLTGTGATGIASNYTPVTAKSLIAGMNLTGTARAAELQKIAQDLGHAGKRPTGTAVGGIPLKANNEPVVVHNGNVVIHVSAQGARDRAEMKRLAAEIRAELLKVYRRNGAQTRGYNAGKGVGLG